MSNKALQKAEKNAKMRDIRKAQLLEEINELTGENYYIGKKRKKHDRVKFVQIIQENWGYLEDKGYLKTEEIKFLNRIIRYIGFRSNCIVNDINQKEQIPLTQKELAEQLGSSKQTVGRLINQLVDKGILAKAESGKEDVNTNARMYAIYVNPNIMFSGDKNDVNETLKTMFLKANKKLKNLPIRLF